MVVETIFLLLMHEIRVAHTLVQLRIINCRFHVEILIEMQMDAISSKKKNIVKLIVSLFKCSHAMTRDRE